MADQLTRAKLCCSPRCGFGCTQKAKDRADQEGVALAARLGPGWEPEVWENWGWNYAASKGVAVVRPKVDGNRVSGDWVVVGYSADVNSACRKSASAETPEDALGFVVQDLRSAQHEIGRDLSALLAGDQTEPAR